MVDRTLNSSDCVSNPVDVGHKMSVLMSLKKEQGLTGFL